MTVFELKEEEAKEIVRKWFPVLLKEDTVFREEVMSHLTGVLATKDDIARILSKLEENSQILQEHSRILQEHSRRMDKFDSTLSAVGSRWGILAEESFRAAMRGVLEDLGYQVKKWRVRDEAGKVYGYSTMQEATHDFVLAIEADILIVNDQRILMEIKSSVSRGDVAAFARVGQVYEGKERIKPRLVMVSPFIDAKAQTLGELIGMELYTSPEEAME